MARSKGSCGRATPNDRVGTSRCPRGPPPRALLGRRAGGGRGGAGARGAGDRRRAGRPGRHRGGVAAAARCPAGGACRATGPRANARRRAIRLGHPHARVPRAGGSPRAPIMTGGLRVAIVAANTFEYDSRLLRTASALVGAGHTVTILGLAGPGLPEREQLASGAALRRLPLDRRVTSAFRPLPQRARRLLARILGFDPEATQLPPGRPHGLDRLRAPLRRVVEIAAHAHRVGPWADAVVGAAPDADVFHAKALIALPVVHAAARRTGARFVYDVADIHTQAARLARIPGGFRAPGR